MPADDMRRQMVGVGNPKQCDDVAGPGISRPQAQFKLLPDQAPWLEDFRAEVLQFPHGRHDDQVDTV